MGFLKPYSYCIFESQMWVSREIWLWNKKREIFFSAQKFRPVQINFLVVLFTCEWMCLRSFFQVRYKPHMGFWHICIYIFQFFTLHGFKVLALASMRPLKPYHCLLSSAQPPRAAEKSVPTAHSAFQFSVCINPQGFASFSCKLSCAYVKIFIDFIPHFLDVF